MAVSVMCTRCRSPLRVAEANIGENVRCPKCQQVFAASHDDGEPPEAEFLGVSEPAGMGVPTDEESIPPLLSPKPSRPERRPRRRDERRPWEAERTGANVGLWVGIGVGGFLLFVVMGVSAYFLFHVHDEPMDFAEADIADNDVVVNNNDVVLNNKDNFPLGEFQPPEPKKRIRPPAFNNPNPKKQIRPPAFNNPNPKKPIHPPAVDNPNPPFNPVQPPVAKPLGEPPSFKPPANPFKKGSQTKLRELSSLKAPGNVTQISYSPKHQLLFLKNSGSGLYVVDLKTKQTLGMRTAINTLSDMSLAPDQSVLFVADFGGERIGYSKPLKPHYIHRYDLVKRAWSKRNAPKIAYRLETVDAARFLLLESDQWVDVTLNIWEQGHDAVTELARVRADYNGDIAYDMRTGRIYHGNHGNSSREINIRRILGNNLVIAGDTGTYGTAKKGGGSVVLSADGSRFYYGRLQVEALDVRNNLHFFPEPIHAASRDLAFGETAYYDSQSGKRIGSLDFQTTVYYVSIDQLQMWTFNPDTDTLRCYALEGEKL